MDIEDFILTEVEIKEIQGKTYAFQYVNFRGIRLPIVGNVSSQDSNLIEYSSKRPIQKTLLQPILSYTTQIREFFIDMGMIFYALNKVEELDDNSIFDVATYMCVMHIKNVGRLIDTDLYAYIDLVVFAKNTIWSKLYNTEISIDEGSKLWVEINQQSFDKLKDFIFLTKYDMSNPMQPKPYLVKYSDL